MCGRYDIIDLDERLVSHFGLSVKPQGYKPRYNAAPSQKLPVITNDEPDRLSFLSSGG